MKAVKDRTYLLEQSCNRNQYAAQSWKRVKIFM
jgi:hypothetical protein